MLLKGKNIEDFDFDRYKYKNLKKNSEENLEENNSNFRNFRNFKIIIAETTKNGPKF
jgi:hypothetical protein